MSYSASEIISIKEKIFDQNKDYNHVNEWKWIINNELQKESCHYTNKNGLFNLKYIDLLDNPITQLPIELMNLKYLQEIDFTGIRFSPEFQKIWLERMPNVNLIFDAPCDCMK